MRSRRGAVLALILAFLVLILGFQNCAQSFSTESETFFMSMAAMGDAYKAGLEVKPILRDHCLKCHGPESKTALKDILDMDGLVRNGYVVPGSPQLSSLYLSVKNGEMPKAYSLESADQEKIENWINLLAQLDGGYGTGKGYRAIRERVLQPKCIRCHKDGNALSEVRVDTYETVMTLVVPRNPEASLLYDTIVQGRMPKGGADVTDEELALIRAWIEAGAPNN